MTGFSCDCNRKSGGKPLHYTLAMRRTGLRLCTIVPRSLRYGPQTARAFGRDDNRASPQGARHSGPFGSAQGGMTATEARLKSRDEVDEGTEGYAGGAFG